MKTLIQFAAVAALSVGVLAACGDDETTAAGPTGTPTTTSANGGSGGGGTGGATTSNGGSGGAGVTGFPAPPKLGNPIDRMGRPAINTVGSKTFSAMADAAKDAYNVNHDEATWVSK
ncbi:MAG: hypothetical protein EXR75_10285, partial [Myxococcales bacterium]|nr:hypothetical protein [Myxococcales bacterium]